jgi:MFS family permease
LQFAIPGAWLPGLYPLLSGARDFTGAQVGLVFAASSVGALAAPFYAGQLADRVLPADRLLGLFHLAGAGLLALLSQVQSFGATLGTCLLLGLVYAPTIGLAHAVCLTHLERREGLGPVRAWGTVGWVFSGIAVAQWLLYRHTPRGVGEEVVRAAQDAGRIDGVVAACVLAAALSLFCFLALPRTPPSGRSRTFAPALAARRFRAEPLRTLILAALLLACVDRYYLFHGAEFLSRWGRDEPGLLERVFGVGGMGLMSLGQVVEIGLLFAFPALARRLAPRRMLIIAAGLFTLRMALFAWVPALPWVLLGVALHGVCFTLFFFAGFLVVDECCPPNVRASGQALFQLVFGGIGGLAGSLLGGATAGWAQVGETLDPQRLFIVPFLLSAVATIFLWLRYPHEHG